MLTVWGRLTLFRPCRGWCVRVPCGAGEHGSSGGSKTQTSTPTESCVARAGALRPQRARPRAGVGEGARDGAGAGARVRRGGRRRARAPAAGPPGRPPARRARRGIRRACRAPRHHGPQVTGFFRVSAPALPSPPLQMQRRPCSRTRAACGRALGFAAPRSCVSYALLCTEPHAGHGTGALLCLAAGKPLTPTYWVCAGRARRLGSSCAASTA